MFRFAALPFVKKLAIGYTVLILLLVTLPLNGQDQLLGNLNDNYVFQIRLDYLSHATLFIPWVLLIWWGWQWSLKSWPAQALGLLAALAFAISCEYIQLPLPYRTFNINDLVSNALSVVLGFLIALCWKTRHRSDFDKMDPDSRFTINTK